MGKIKYSSLCGIINPQTCKKNIWIDDEKKLDKVGDKDKIKGILKLPWEIEKYAEKLERDLNGLFMSLYYYIQMCVRTVRYNRLSSMEDKYNSIYKDLKSPKSKKSVSKKEDTPKIDEGVKEIYRIARKKIKTLKRDHELEKREILNYKKVIEIMSNLMLQKIF